jgi:hypothetical protein
MHLFHSYNQQKHSQATALPGKRGIPERFRTIAAMFFTIFRLTLQGCACVGYAKVVALLACLCCYTNSSLTRTLLLLKNDLPRINSWSSGRCAQIQKKSS